MFDTTWSISIQRSCDVPGNHCWLWRTFQCHLPFSGGTKVWLFGCGVVKSRLVTMYLAARFAEDQRRHFAECMVNWLPMGKSALDSNLRNLFNHHVSCLIKNLRSWNCHIVFLRTYSLTYHIDTRQRELTYTELTCQANSLQTVVSAFFNST